MARFLNIEIGASQMRILKRKVEQPSGRGERSRQYRFTLLGSGRCSG